MEKIHFLSIKMVLWLAKAEQICYNGSKLCPDNTAAPAPALLPAQAGIQMIIL